MRTNFKLIMLCLFSLLGVSNTFAVDIPTTKGTYIQFYKSMLANANVDGIGKANSSDEFGPVVGSTRANAVITVPITNTCAQDYFFSFKSGASGLTATYSVELIDASNNKVLNESASILNTGSWTPSTFHAYYIENLPVGNYTLKVACTSTTGSYAGNLGYFSFYAPTDYDTLPCALSVVGTGFRADDGIDVGWIQNGSTGSFSFYCPAAAKYDLDLPLNVFNAGTLTVTVTDVISNTVEASTTFALETTMKSYGLQRVLSAVNMTKGIKSMTFTFNNDSGFICNFHGPVWSYTPESVSFSQEVATFSSDLAVEIPEGVEAYIVETVSGGIANLAKLEGNIPAGCGVILRNVGEETTYSLPVTTENIPSVANALVATGCDGADVLAGDFVLANGKSGIGFYPLKSAGNLGAHKAYIPQAQGAALAAICFNFDGETNGIGQTIANSQLSNGQTFNLAGQKVNADYKGIVIKNGKKIIIK